jgi:HlyD family secretion protein
VKKLLLVLLLLGGLLAGVASWLRWERTPPLGPDSYSLSPVEFGRTTEVVSATGVVQAGKVYQVGTQLSGKVVQVLADFNQVVEEGEVLLRLDDQRAQENLKQAELAVSAARVGVRQAEAARGAAEKTLQRERERAPEVRRQVDVDLAESQLESARAGVEAARVKVEEAEEARRQAEEALRRTVIRAPVLAAVEVPGHSAAQPGAQGVGSLAPEGAATREKRTFTVLDRRVELNQQVGPPASAHLFTLAADLERMRVHVQVAEGDVHKVMRGLPAEFTVSGGDDNEPVFRGKVEDVRLVPVSEHGAVYYRVILDVPNERNPVSGDWRLRPGLTASVDILRRTHERVWKVPAAALNFHPEGSALTEAARAKLARWQSRPDHDLWSPVWVVGADGRPSPVLVRLGGVNARGETGIQEAQSTEVLEWDPELQPRPDPRDPAAMPRLIIGMPPAPKGLFTAPTIKF